MMRRGRISGPIPHCLMFEGWESVVRRWIPSKYQDMTTDQYLQFAQVEVPLVLKRILIDLYDRHPERGGKL